jgi:hypothetical protein
MDTLPKRELVSPDIRREEYHLFRAAIPHDERLPPGYDAWLALQFRAKRDAESAGMTDKRVAVRYHAFMRYAQRMRLPASHSLLLAYAVSLNASTSPVASDGWWYRFTTTAGVFNIVVRQQTWQVMFRGQSLGRFGSAEDAARALCRGDVPGLPAGMNAADLGFPADLSGWEAKQEVDRP